MFAGSTTRRRPVLLAMRTASVPQLQTRVHTRKAATGLHVPLLPVNMAVATACCGAGPRWLGTPWRCLRVSAGGGGSGRFIWVYRGSLHAAWLYLPPAKFTGMKLQHLANRQTGIAA